MYNNQKPSVWLGKLKEPFLVASLLLILPFLPTSLWADTYRLTFFDAQENVVPNLRSGLEEAYRRIGHQVEFIRLPGRRALKEANSGKYDGACMRNFAIQKEAPNLRAIIAPLIEARMVLFGKPGTIYKKPEDLSGLSVALIRGTKPAEIFVKRYNIKSAYIPDLKSAFMMLDSDRVDAVIFMAGGGMRMIKSMGLKGIKIIGPPIFKKIIYHWVHKKNNALIPQLEPVIESLVNEGVFPGK